MRLVQSLRQLVRRRTPSVVTLEPQRSLEAQAEPKPLFINRENLERLLRIRGFIDKGRGTWMHAETGAQVNIAGDTLDSLEYQPKESNGALGIQALRMIAAEYHEPSHEVIEDYGEVSVKCPFGGFMEPLSQLGRYQRRGAGTGTKTQGIEKIEQEGSTAVMFSNHTPGIRGAVSDKVGGIVDSAIGPLFDRNKFETVLRVRLSERKGGYEMTLARYRDAFGTDRAGRISYFTFSNGKWVKNRKSSDIDGLAVPFSKRMKPGPEKLVIAREEVPLGALSRAAEPNPEAERGLTLRK